MKARDVIVSPVIAVGENETVRDVARLLIAKRISAVPVVDGGGTLVGIVTEADLMHRAEAGTEHSYSWWLSLFLGDRAIAADYVKSHALKVKDIMTREVRTADPETPLYEIADLFEENHIKRVPIVSEGGGPGRHCQPCQHHPGRRKRQAHAQSKSPRCCNPGEAHE